MNATQSHLEFMSAALLLAEKGRYTVSPNPMVGCLIVKDGKIIGEGYHHQPGEPHAEIYALQQAGNDAQGATMYVTLEPCCHTGRTPPCTDALIQSGIRDIYIACVDPNPLVAGKGMQTLENAGIQVHIGLCEDKARQLNEIFFHYISHRRPFVIAKWAMSLDGKTITHQDDSPVISSHDAKVHAHDIRAQVDAVLIGANTAKQDDPLLTVRFTRLHKCKQPVRIILSSRGELPSHLRLLNLPLATQTIVATTHNITNEKQKMLEDKNITVIRLPADHLGHISLPALLDELGKLQIASILVEGGRQVHDSFIQDNLVNQYHVYLSPVIISQLSQKQTVHPVQITHVKQDLFIAATNKGDRHV